jgi:DNA-binding NarL/FixJ family response regulator
VVEPVTVAVVEDHPLMLGALVSVCEQHPQLVVVYAGASVDDVLELDPAPDLVLLDLDLNGSAVTEGDAERLMARGSAVIVVSGLASPATVRAMVRAGVAGLLSKRDDPADLWAAIDSVLAGRPWTTSDLAAVLVRDPDRPDLSYQERRALELYASGLKLASVARLMGLAPSTVREYIDRVRAKYAAVGRPAPTKAHLAVNAHQDGIITGSH